MSAWWDDLMGWRQPRGAAANRRQGDERVAGMQDDEGSLPGCGWFESSWDLQHGLAVVEGTTLEQAVWQLVQGGDAAQPG